MIFDDWSVVNKWLDKKLATKRVIKSKKCIKKCEFCEIEFEPVYGKPAQRFCSYQCGQLMENERRKLRRAERMARPVDASPPRKKTWKIDCFGRTLSDSPTRNHIKSIPLPIVQESYRWLYGRKDEGSGG
jgi:hypothetical protein